MKKRVAVCGTGNVGRPAIRAVVSHRELELVAVIVSSDKKVGQDAGTLAGIEEQGITAVKDWQSLLVQNIDCVVYTVNADTRGEEAFMELFALISAVINVVSTAFYPLLYPPGKDSLREAIEPVQAVCEQNDCSVFVSGIDPGWAMDILPILLSGVVSDISEIRNQEIFKTASTTSPR